MVTPVFLVVSFEKRSHSRVLLIAAVSIPVFFNYEISPLMVIHRETRQSFAHFLTSTCAIVGGILTMAGLIDSFVVSAGVYRTSLSSNG